MFECIASQRDVHPIHSNCRSVSGSNADSTCDDSDVTDVDAGSHESLEQCKGGKRLFHHTGVNLSLHRVGTSGGLVVSERLSSVPCNILSVEYVLKDTLVNAALVVFAFL
jgi:hypothetical protein